MTYVSDTPDWIGYAVTMVVVVLGLLGLLWMLVREAHRAAAFQADAATHAASAAHERSERERWQGYAARVVAILGPRPDTRTRVAPEYHAPRTDTAAPASHSGWTQR